MINYIGLQGFHSTFSLSNINVMFGNFEGIYGMKYKGKKKKEGNKMEEEFFFFLFKCLSKKEKEN